jgi:tetratricopeptide (TPR) repeat protein
MWDQRVLQDLRRRLAAEEDAARRSQQLQPRSTPWRATYGSVAPLAVPPAPAAGPHDNLSAFRREIARLEALIAGGRGSAGEYFLHGLIHYASGRWSVAVRDFDEAIRLGGNPIDQLYCLRGLAHYGLGEYRAAWDDLNEAVRRSPSIRNVNNRGVIACACGEAERALRDFDAALAIRQWTVKAGPVSVNRALALSDLGRHEQAAAELKSLIESSGDPEIVDPANRAAGLVYRRRGDFGRSGISYDIAVQAVRADEQAAHGQPGTPAIDRMPGDHSLLDEFAGEETAADALIGRGVAHHELNQIVPAIEDYGQAIRHNPRRTAAYVNRAVAYVDRGDPDLAERDLATALRLDPNDAYALGNRGLLRMRQGQAALGRADLARATALRSDLRPVIQRILGRERLPQAAGESTRLSPWAAPETPALGWSPALGSSPAATTPASARRPYAAATPAEAVERLAEAGKGEDLEATIETLASPVREGFGNLRAAAARMDIAMARYRAAKNNRSGGFFNPASGPLERQIDVEKRKHAAVHKFVVQEMTVLSQHPVATPEVAAFRLVVRTIKANSLGETQTPKQVFYAVREEGNWRLLPESVWAAASGKERRSITSYFDQQVARLEAMRAITEQAARAIADRKPVNELAVLVAWNQVSEGVPWPGTLGDEPPTLAEAFLKALNSMLWDQGAPPGMAQPGLGPFQQPPAGQADAPDAQPGLKPSPRRPSQSSPARPTPSGPAE